MRLTRNPDSFSSAASSSSDEFEHVEMPTEPEGEPTIKQKERKTQDGRWSLVLKEGEGEDSLKSKKTLIKSPLAGLNLVRCNTATISDADADPRIPRNVPLGPLVAPQTSPSAPPTSSSTRRIPTSTRPGIRVPRCTCSPSRLAPPRTASPKRSPWELKALARRRRSRPMASGLFGSR